MNTISQILLLVGLLSALPAVASEHLQIDTLGASAKGQFVAIEESGYRRDTHVFVVTIKIVNVWTTEYVGSEVRVELPAFEAKQLTVARARARLAAQGQLLKYRISG